MGKALGWEVSSLVHDTPVLIGVKSLKSSYVNRTMVLSLWIATPLGVTNLPLGSHIRYPA